MIGLDLYNETNISVLVVLHFMNSLLVVSGMMSSSLVSWNPRGCVIG